MKPRRTTAGLARAAALFLSVSALACAPVYTDPTTGAGATNGQSTTRSSTTALQTSSTQTSSSTSTSTSSNTTTGALSTTSDDSATTACEFICDDDSPAGEWQCDPFTNDCPQGQKCAPYDADGNNAWDATQCVPLTGDAQLYEPCVAAPIDEGGDSCGEHLMCWFHNADAEGVCVGTCLGSPEQPSCADACASCYFPGAGIPALCMPGCDPLAPACANASTCREVAKFGPGFFCDYFPQTSPLGAPCYTSSGCEEGLACVTADKLPTCDDDACCARLCDLQDGADDNPACLELGVPCVPWFVDSDACDNPNVGVCRLP